MIPATISTSVGFMMPVGTPPNAIAFSTGRARFDQMAKYGFVLNIIGIILVSAVTLLWMVPVMGISTDKLPSWARDHMPTRSSPAIPVK